MTSEQVDQIFKEMIEFEQSGLGIKCGPEFPEIAKALMQSSSYRKAIIAATSTASVMYFTLPFDKLAKISGDLEKLEEETIKWSPMRELLGVFVFLGYKLAMLEAETKVLEKIHKAE